MKMSIKNNGKIKILSLILAITMVFSVAALNVNAQEGLTLVSEGGNVTVGDYITVNIKVGSAATANTVQFELDFSPTILQVNSISFANGVFAGFKDVSTYTIDEKNPIDANPGIYTYKYSNSTGKITFAASSAKNINFAKDDLIMKIKFKAKKADTSNLKFDNVVASTVTTDPDTGETSSGQIASPIQQGVVDVDPAPSTGGTSSGSKNNNNSNSSSNYVIYNGLLNNTNSVLNTADHYRYMFGYEDGTIRPDATITREEIAEIFYRLLKSDTRNANRVNASAFSDVESNRWSAMSIGTMQKAGYITGDQNGLFRPTDPITRAELVTMATRFGAANSSATVTFKDVSGHWALQAITTAVANGWVKGYTDGTFLPDNAVTRAEAMAIINRILGRSVDSQGLLQSIKTTWSDLPVSHWAYYDVMEATVSHTYTRRSTGSNVENWTGKANDVNFNN